MGKEVKALFDVAKESLTDRDTVVLDMLAAYINWLADTQEELLKVPNTKDTVLRKNNLINEYNTLLELLYGVYSTYGEKAILGYIVDEGLDTILDELSIRFPAVAEVVKKILS